MGSVWWREGNIQYDVAYFNFRVWDGIGPGDLLRPNTVDTTTGGKAVDTCTVCDTAIVCTYNRVVYTAGFGLSGFLGPDNSWSGFLYSPTLLRAVYSGSELISDTLYLDGQTVDTDLLPLSYPELTYFDQGADDYGLRELFFCVRLTPATVDKCAVYCLIKQVVKEDYITDISEVQSREYDFVGIYDGVVTNLTDLFEQADGFLDKLKAKEDPDSLYEYTYDYRPGIALRALAAEVL